MEENDMKKLINDYMELIVKPQCTFMKKHWVALSVLSGLCTVYLMIKMNGTPSIEFDFDNDVDDEEE